MLWVPVGLRTVPVTSLQGGGLLTRLTGGSGVRRTGSTGRNSIDSTSLTRSSSGGLPQEPGWGRREPRTLRGSQVIRRGGGHAPGRGGGQRVSERAGFCGAGLEGRLRGGRPAGPAAARRA